MRGPQSRRWQGGEINETKFSRLEKTGDGTRFMARRHGAREALHHQIYDKTLTRAKKERRGGPRPAAVAVAALAVARSAYFMDAPAAAGTLY